MEGRIGSFFCLALVASTFGFNIDTESPVIFRGGKDTEFGFTVGLNTDKDGSVAFVAAPKGDYSEIPENRKAGVLYKCNISTTECLQVPLDSPWNVYGTTIYGNEYKEEKLNMHLGISLDMQPGRSGAIVTCGHKWKNSFHRGTYILNGACYVIDNNLNKNTVSKLLPLTKRSMQIVGETINQLNYYIHGMAGFSAAYTEDGTHLLLGAPGVYEGTGSIIDYKVGLNMERQVPYIFRPEDMQEEVLTFNSYIGYSVSSGQFYENGKTSYVVGAPRAEDDYGCVYVFEQFSPLTSAIIQDKLTGKKMGEYFGYAILGVNLNNDKYTDLLVGAPFHSETDMGDEGRVYVYISDGRAIQEHSEKLEGSKKPNSRFGTAVNAAGDINMDGYTDIAVGAPYEDDVGAVYIYHGTADGIEAKYVQRIVPEQLKVDLSGFGFSVARGKDIDSNSYPDLLIGAYSSDSAVLLRSHPVISVQANMDFNIKQINVNSSDCEIDYLKESCFGVTYCLEYTGKFVPESVNMTITLETDVQNFIRPRTYFIEGSPLEKKSKIEIEVTLHNNIDNCNKRKVFVKKNVEDFISPIPFHMTYEIKKSSSPHFCSTCAVLNGNLPNRITSQVMFWTGCGDDNECLSNLKVEVSFIGLSDDAIVIGEQKALVVEITTTNEGEPAYQSTVRVCMPYNIKIINKGECSADYDDPMTVSLKCNVGNPLQPGKASFQLKLDTSKLPNNLTELEFEVTANTTSTEIDSSDNYVVTTVPVISKASIRLIGSTDSEIIYLKEKMPEKIPIMHKYTVSKSMPSPVSSVDITMSIPFKLTTDQRKFLEISDIIVENTGMNGHCNDSAEDIPHKEGPHFKSVHRKDISGNRYVPSDHPDHADFDTTIVDCSTAICHTFHCVIGPFIHHEIATFQISGTINIKVLQEVVGEKDITVIISEGLATIRDENMQLKSLKNTDITVVTTTLEKYNLHKTKKIALWIIIVSVVVGILLLALLILLLVKLGFFRRKEREEMDKMTESGHLLKKDEPSHNMHEEERALYDDDDRNT